jgi:hypothetical protein
MRLFCKIVVGTAFVALIPLARQGKPLNPTDQKTQVVAKKLSFSTASLAKGWQLRYHHRAPL